MTEYAEVELTPKAYGIIRDTLIESLQPNLKPLVNRALEFFRSIKPIDAVESVLYNKTVKDYYNSLSYSHPYKIALGIAKGVVKAKPEYLEELKAKVTPDFVLMVLKYENPETYKTLKENVSPEKMHEWIRRNIEEFIEIITPNKGK